MIITNEICKVQDLTKQMQVSFEEFDKGYNDAVAMSAWASFNKVNKNFTIQERDKLIDYLAEHKHKSPFFHSQQVFVMPTLEWESLNLLYLRSHNRKTIGQDEWRSLVFYTSDKPAEPFTYILCSQYFWQKFKMFAEDNKVKINVSQDFLQWKAEQVKIVVSGNYIYDILQKPLTNLNLCVFEPTIEWIFQQSDIVEASRLVRLSFLIEAPIFVIRQLDKHQVDVVKNETSGRYVIEKELKFYKPDKWRKKASTNKQGSLPNEFVEENVNYNADYCLDYEDICDKISAWYQINTQNEMCGEQARMILGSCKMTSFVWTMTLNAFLRICQLRLHPDAQIETADVVKECLEVVKKQVPNIEKLIKLY